jgi:hypothetical protein
LHHAADLHLFLAPVKLIGFPSRERQGDKGSHFGRQLFIVTDEALDAVIKCVRPGLPAIQYSGTESKSKFIRRTGKLAPARLLIFTFAFMVDLLLVSLNQPILIFIFS